MLRRYTATYDAEKAAQAHALFSPADRLNGQLQDDGNGSRKTCVLRGLPDDSKFEALAIAPSLCAFQSGSRGFESHPALWSPTWPFKDRRRIEPLTSKQAVAASIIVFRSLPTTNVTRHAWPAPPIGGLVFGCHRLSPAKGRPLDELVVGQELK